MQFTTQDLENILGKDLVISSEERIHNVLLEERAALPHQRKTRAPQQAKPALTQTLPTVRNALLQAETWQNEIESGTYSSFEDLAQHYQVSSKTIIRYMVFNTLSPKVKEAILNDTLDPKFRIVDFTRKNIPDDWSVQERMFGVGG